MFNSRLLKCMRRLWVEHNSFLWYFCGLYKKPMEIHSFFTYYFYFYLFSFLHMSVSVQMPQYARRGPRITCSLFSPSNAWVLGIRLGSPGIVASVFTHRAILPAHIYYLLICCLLPIFFQQMCELSFT